ncbi:HpcH/HpaI aldolase/citrate lyase family protein [Sciscionella sediminilitoris]|uniref:HpcH/HpaI aldolase/citrate lyase family protein n=1 Tax=Sciscionella sediminilitoris TaxID=1445613 RepID=UPI0004DF7874|nr:CoA ester lyase [Sciscionella sp. SE31]
MKPLEAATTFLFVPGDRPDRFDKVTASGADVAILDLEDAVGPQDKDVAREHIRVWLAAGGQAMVRINAAGTPWFDADLDLAYSQQAPVMLPKAEKLDVVASLSGLSVLPLVETAAGVANVARLCAAPGVVRLAFGSVDLAAQLGVAHDDPVALDHARARLVLASAAAGIAAPIDGVTTNLREDSATSHDARHARRLGFRGKLCVHPRQLEAVRAAFAPTADELAWARRVTAAAGTSAAAIDGEMVDKPIVDRARRLLESQD